MRKLRRRRLHEHLHHEGVEYRLVPLCLEALVRYLRERGRAVPDITDVSDTPLSGYVVTQVRDDVDCPHCIAWMHA